MQPARHKRGPPVLFTAGIHQHLPRWIIALPDAFEEWICQDEELVLHPGDMLLLYSDGVTEAANAAGEEFGEDRLARILRESAAPDAESLVGEIVERVSAFSGASLVDDITVFAIRGV